MVSIITPTHYKGELWEVTVESVLQQTCKDFEWIVLDNSEDGYFNDSFLKFKESHPEYEDVYDKVKIYRENKQGQEKRPVGVYKNMCARLTSCSDDDFILILDHDDFIAKTTVEDIINCDKKYKYRLDYITGFSLCLIYDINEKTYKVKDDMNPNLTVNIKNIEPITIGQNFKLAVENFYSPQYVDLNYQYFASGLNSHPRAIKKRLLYNNVFQFHVNSLLEEDTPQVYLAPLFFNIGWISRATVCYILYKDGENFRNSCINKVFNFETYVENERLKSAITLIYEGVRNIVCSDTNNKMFLFDDFVYDGTTNPDSEWIETINNLKQTTFR